MFNVSFYNYDFKALTGGPLVLGTGYVRGPILLVNTASECGLTPQYKELQELYEKYKSRGLKVVGVPCNDFGGQEPGDAKQISEFCEINYGVTFPLTAKESVIGADAHPLYRTIEKELGESAVPKWNFHKYLFNAAGDLIEFFGSKTEPHEAHLIAAIEKLLVEQSDNSDKDED